jgi:tape measure domain-containing protein
MTKSILVATGITKGLSAAWNLVSSSTGSAIERFDQLNAFPKVMNSLGISTEKAEKASKKLAENLKGLPTTLNDATSSVSRFVSKNEDIERSTEMFLAVNNAIIAGNAPMVNQQAALEQLTQAYSRGKPELNEWKSLMVAMPGQMKQVAKAMGYVDTDALYEALLHGKVSMDDFMDAIIRLNNEGIDGLESFQNQAKNAVGGIGTAMTNMKTAVARGVANMITSLDTTLKKANIKGGIAGLIGNIGKGFEEGLGKLSNLLEPFISGLITGKGLTEATTNLTTTLFDAVSNAIQYVNDNIPEIILKLSDVAEGIAEGIEKGLPKIAEKSTKILQTINTELGKEENKEKMADIGTKLIEALFKAIETFIDNKGIIMLVDAFNKVMNFPKEVGEKIVINLVAGIAEKFGLPKEKVKEIANAIRDVIKAIPGKMRELGGLIVQGLIDGITSRFAILQAVADKLGGIVSKVVKLKNKIHSPSKLFEYYGEMIGEGYINGIDSMKKEISKTALDTFSISPQLASSTSLNNSPNVVVNNSISMETDPLGQTVSQIKTFSGGAKNDYNYGMGV